MSNVEYFTDRGLMNVDGWTPMKVGKLDKHTRQPLRYNDRIVFWHDIYSGKEGEYVAKEYAPNSRDKYRLVTKDGAFLPIAKIAYDALTLPEVGS